jgi:hypothetical protein
MFLGFPNPRETRTATSLLWFPTIQRIKREQDPADLVPQGCFVSARAIERKIGQICEGQKAARLETPQRLYSSVLEFWVCCAFGPEPWLVSA